MQDHSFDKVSFLFVNLKGETTLIFLFFALVWLQVFCNAMFCQRFCMLVLLVCVEYCKDFTLTVDQHSSTQVQTSKSFTESHGLDFILLLGLFLNKRCLNAAFVLQGLVAKLYKQDIREPYKSTVWLL